MNKLEKIRQLSQRTMKRITEQLKTFENRVDKIIINPDTEDANSYKVHTLGKIGVTKQLSKRHYSRMSSKR